MEDVRRESMRHIANTYRVWGRHPGLYDVQDWITFMGRHREIRHRAVEVLGLRPGDRVLEVGCGTGRNLPYLMEAIGPEGQMIGVDYTPEMLESVRERVRKNRWPNVRLVQADAASMDLEEAPFDGIVSVLAVSCIPDHLKALEGCLNMLRPGGILSVCDARPFPGKLRVLNPLIRPVYARSAAWNPDRDLPRDMKRIFGNVEVETRNWGSFFIAASRK